MMPSPSVDMQSVIIDESMQPLGRRELVVPAQGIVPRSRCHTSHVIEIGGLRRRGPLPRVVYGSPMRCPQVQIVWVDPGR